MAAKIAWERVERAARMYRGNQEAGAALGIAASSFGRLCREYGIETPKAARERRQAEMRRRKEEEDEALDPEPEHLSEDIRFGGREDDVRAMQSSYTHGRPYH